MSDIVTPAESSPESVEPVESASGIFPPSQPDAFPGSSLSVELQASLREKALSDLYFFSKGILGYDRMVPKIHRPLCRLLELYSGYDGTLSTPWSEYESVLRRTFAQLNLTEEVILEKLAEIKSKGIKKLLILLPRGWYKTTMVSIAYPLWRGVRDSNVRVLLAQNTSSNAVSKGSALGAVVKNAPLFALLFPEVMPTDAERWSEGGRCLKRSKQFAESTFEFAGIRTQVTSRHFNLIIEDDTVAPDKDDLGESSILPSKNDVSQAIGWHRLVPPLLDEIEKDQNIVVGTRWFVKDLLAWVMENEPGFVVYQRAVKEGANGKPSPQGAPAWDERFSEGVLRDLALSLGPYLFSCLYMNTPVQAENMLFLDDWIRYFDVEPASLMTFTTVDLANDPLDTKSEPDYNVVLTCGKDMISGRVYVLDYARERCAPSRTLELIFEHVNKWHPATVGIETVGYQKSLLPWIRQFQVSSGKYFMVTPLSHNKASKGARIRGLQPAVASGALLFRTHMQALVNEMLVYPLGVNDDLVDALAMQLELWKITPSRDEEAQRVLEGSATDFSTMLHLARETQKSQDEKAVATAPPPAWGGSIPVLVFQHEASEDSIRQFRPQRTPEWWGAGTGLGRIRSLR